MSTIDWEITMRLQVDDFPCKTLRIIHFKIILAISNEIHDMLRMACSSIKFGTNDNLKN